MRSGDRAARPALGRAAVIVLAATVVLAAVVLAIRTNVNGDVTYALGGLETAGRGGVSVWDIFIARPVVYKLLIAALDGGRHLLVGDSSLPTADLVIRLETYVLIVGVAVVLLLGVRRVAGLPAAAGIATATGLALIVAPPWHFLEPDWVAPFCGVLAVGAALLPRRVWLGALLGGFATMLVVAVKLATFPVALLTLLVVALFDRRRAAWVALSAAVFVALWYVATMHFLPWEWTWLRDQANLVHGSPIHHGIRRSDLHKLFIALGDVAVLSPIVVLAPAAAVALIHRLPAGRSRSLGVAVALVAGLLSVLSGYAQGEFFAYHFAVVPILAAGVGGAAFALVPAVRWALALATAAVTALSLALLRLPAGWRHAHVGRVALAYALIGLGLAALTWFLAGRSVPALPWAFGVVALGVALLPPVLPGDPYAFGIYNYTVYNRPSSNGELTDLGRRLGPDTPVLYLTFGTYNHALGNPTSCRYPSPQWLQRANSAARVRTFPSYQDNLRCLTDDGHRYRYLVMQPAWFDLARADAQVRTLIDQRFDCSAAARVPAPAALVVCPTR
ncbi:hypothetical protein ODJ79_21165 [Actinoplanes sp. KI2]|uniref:hypothetical protein n=1 Tax=Actinoplanes sp. KI2 TaxID=2983315 RepID=UPI0021D5DDFC|nr:hypothetical protein [Actinoplanes sp. KI2]MCU7726246.1 hypothetical protein [Actinoplanes sp. KI2]